MLNKNPKKAPTFFPEGCRCGENKKKIQKLINFQIDAQFVNLFMININNTKKVTNIQHFLNLNHNAEECLKHEIICTAIKCVNNLCFIYQINYYMAKVYVVIL